MTAPLKDGRFRRGDRSRQALVAACRQLMAEGRLAPSMERIAALAVLSVRTGFQHFASIELLYRAALEDDGLRAGLARAILGDHFETVPAAVRDRIVAVVVFQQLPPLPDQQAAA